MDYLAKAIQFIIDSLYYLNHQIQQSTIYHPRCLEDKPAGWASSLSDVKISVPSIVLKALFSELLK